MSEKSPILSSSEPEQLPIYQEKTKTKTFNLILGAFLGFVVLNLAISVIIVAVRAATHNGLFALLLVSLFSFAQVEFFLVFFILRGHLPRVHIWSIFVVGTFVIIESISTDIIVCTVD